MGEKVSKYRGKIAEIGLSDGEILSELKAHTLDIVALARKKAGTFWIATYSVQDMAAGYLLQRARISVQDSEKLKSKQRRKAFTKREIKRMIGQLDRIAVVSMALATHFRPELLEELTSGAQRDRQSDIAFRFGQDIAQLERTLGVNNDTFIPELHTRFVALDSRNRTRRTAGKNELSDFLAS